MFSYFSVFFISFSFLSQIELEHLKEFYRDRLLIHVNLSNLCWPYKRMMAACWRQTCHNNNYSTQLYIVVGSNCLLLVNSVINCKSFDINCRLLTQCICNSFNAETVLLFILQHSTCHSTQAELRRNSEQLVQFGSSGGSGCFVFHYILRIIFCVAQDKINELRHL